MLVVRIPKVFVSLLTTYDVGLEPKMYYRRSRTVCVFDGKKSVIPRAKHESYIGTSTRVYKPIQFVTPDCILFYAFLCMCIKVFIFVIFLLDWNKCKELHYNQVALRFKTYVHEGKNLYSEYINVKIVLHTKCSFMFIRYFISK